jgi:hypothetical protein
MDMYTSHKLTCINHMCLPRSEKTAKTGVFRRCFTSVRNMTKMAVENDGRLLAKKRLIKRAEVLRRNAVKSQVVTRRFIAFSGCLRRSE